MNAQTPTDLDAAIAADDRRRFLLRAKKMILESRTSLLSFAQYMRPNPKNLGNPLDSVYQVEPHHAFIADRLEALERGDITRLILSVPPRHGKSELASKTFIPWAVGRNPDWSIIMATYNQNFAGDFGRAVRGTLQDPRYHQVFPDLVLQAGSKAADRMNTESGSQLTFVGRGGSLTGRGGHCLIIDDPIKDRKEADSGLVRDQLWTWYTQVFLSRAMVDDVRVLLIQCMTGDTPVLMEDGTETLLRDIRPGDRVKSYDTETGEIVTETVLNWINQGEDEIFAMKMKSGKTVKANARHPFRVVNQDGTTEWRRMGTLKPGQSILRVIGESTGEKPARLTDATSPPNAKGSATRTTAKTAAREGLNRLPQLRQRLVAAHTSNIATVSRLKSAMQSWLNKVAFALSAKTSPHGLPRTTGPTGYALTTVTTPGNSGVSFATPVTGWSPKTPTPTNWKPQQITSDEILEIVPAGREDVFDIQVSNTENFFANHLCSSNTRWSEDDLIGRLTDKHNPNYSHTEAAKWEVINLPALANDDDPLGRKKGEPLWPKRFGTGFLAGMRDQDARGFSALYQGEPAPDTGLFFGPDDIREYHKMDQVPKNLRIYGASDHAVSTEQWADKTCLMMFGVDEEDNIWIFPETRLDKIPSNTQVEIMLNLIKKRRPMFWFAEKGHITKSIGPFLRKRMQEEGVWTGLFELTPTTDKQQRAQSIKGRMAAQKVFFPSFASWYQEARRQILTFPAGAKDDFVDTLSMVGLGLSMQVKAKPRKSTGTTKPGTFGALKAETRKRDLRRKLAEQRDGW